jgi:hypothetical protein
VEWLRHTIEDKTKAAYWDKDIEEAAPAHGRMGALLQDTKGDEPNCNPDAS